MIIGDLPRRCDSLDELWHIAYADLGLDYWLTPCCQTLPTPPLPARHIIRFRLTHGWNTIYWLFTLLGTLYMVLFIRDILYQLHWLLPALKEFHNIIFLAWPYSLVLRSWKWVGGKMREFEKGKTWGSGREGFLLRAAKRLLQPLHLLNCLEPADLLHCTQHSDVFGKFFAVWKSCNGRFRL